MASSTENTNKTHTIESLQEEAFGVEMLTFNKDMGKVRQVYFNPNGNGGDGQYVENILYASDILEFADLAVNYAENISGDTVTERFWNLFMSDARQYLYDVKLTDDFIACHNEFLKEYNAPDFKLLGSENAETMRILVKLACEYEGADVNKFSLINCVN